MLRLRLWAPWDILTKKWRTLPGRCRCPVGKVRGPSAADPGQPSTCSQSRSPTPAWSLLLLHILQCHGNVVAEASCLSSKPCRWFHVVMTRPLTSPLVCLGGNSVSGCPSLWSHYVWLFTCHSCLGSTLSLSYTHIHTHTHFTPYRIWPRFLKITQINNLFHQLEWVATKIVRATGSSSSNGVDSLQQTPMSQHIYLYYTLTKMEQSELYKVN